ncbi:hypothetical protein F5050DRAFT_1714860 [Lentinula boryana]|uniref:Fungal N-terminal domain-containing protein n=1 Tax=Lentinula boryana TaxID=40481 RepID=A0ABQ8Q2P3_9AGAR|nr:hypothetical protein F5050DRAFT_1714860 [Lentinula boryana]
MPCYSHLSKKMRDRKDRDLASSASSIPSHEPQKRKTKQGIGKEEFFTALSGATSLTLDALHSAAAFAPIPYLGEAAQLAMSIWDAVQTAQDTKVSLRALGSDAISLVYAVMTTCDEVLKRNTQKGSEPVIEDAPELKGSDGENKDKEEESSKDPEQAKDEEKLNPELRRNLEGLCLTLADIEHFAKHVASRNIVLRFLTARSDAGKVVEFQNKMKMALDLFALQSNITLRQVTCRIETQQAQLLTTLQSPISPISPSSTFSFSSPPKGANLPSVISASDTLNSPPGSTNVPAQEIYPASVGHPPARKESNVLRENAAISGAGAASAAFPAIFSFAGATFRTGDAHSVRHTAPREGNPKPNEEEVEQSRQKKTLGPEPEDAKGSSSGGIHFTSIAGDQNMSWINDQSRRSNYGNVYTSNENSQLRNAGIGRPTTQSRSQRPGPEDDEAWSGRQIKNPFGAIQPPAGTMMTYGTHGDWIGGYGPGEAFAAPNQHPNKHFQPQISYDENGVPTAVPRGRGRSGRRWRDESDPWDTVERP